MVNLKSKNKLFVVFLLSIKDYLGPLTVSHISFSLYLVLPCDFTRPSLYKCLSSWYPIQDFIFDRARSFGLNITPVMFGSPKTLHISSFDLMTYHWIKWFILDPYILLRQLLYSFANFLSFFRVCRPCYACLLYDRSCITLYSLLFHFFKITVPQEPRYIMSGG